MTKIVSKALKFDGSDTIYVCDDYFKCFLQAREACDKYLHNKEVLGYVDQDGKFYSAREASLIMSKTDQI